MGRKPLGCKRGFLFCRHQKLGLSAHEASRYKLTAHLVMPEALLGYGFAGDNMEQSGKIANRLIGQWANSQEINTTANRPNSPIGASKLTVKQADSIMDSVNDLVTSAYRPKYFKALYRLGAVAFLNFADRARQGRYPQHLFRYLIDGSN